MRRALDPNRAPIDYSTRELLGDIFEFLRPYRWRFLLASAIRLSSDLVGLYPSFALASVVTILSQPDPASQAGTLYLITGLWAAAFLYRFGILYYAKSIAYNVAERVSIDAQLSAVRHLFLLDMAWHEKENTGNKLKRIQRAGAGFDRLLRIWINNIIEIVVTFVGVIIILARFDGVFSAIMLTFMVAYMIISVRLIRKAGEAEYAVGLQEEQVTGLLFETINNIRSVKVMAMIRSLYAVIEQESAKLRERIGERIFRFQSRTAILALFSNVIRFGTIMFILYGILHGRYEVGLLILFYNYFMNVWQSLNELSDVSQEFVVAKYSIARLKAIRREPITIDNEEGKASFPRDWRVITFEHVSFSYGGTMVLDDVSFELRRGERVGIVGLSGAGKSTIFKLLLKEYENYEGEILVDDVPLRSIRKTDYFNYISVVLQDTEVFNFSLRDNIVLANTRRAEDERLLKSALAIAHIPEFMHKLPQGLETKIGEKGVRLSGGERQRLGIARAIFRTPQILLMDEATSHLDLESEEKIRDSLHQFFQTVTAIVIAHRLTTIREMDRILVLERGSIIESGTFSQLQKAKGRFYELWEKQRL